MTRRRPKSFKKRETCIFEDVSKSWIFKNVTKENYSRLTEKKRQKTGGKFFFLPRMSPNITLEREKNRNSEEKDRRGRKKGLAAPLVFMLSSLKTAFEREKLNCLMGRFYFGCKVIAQKILYT